MKTALLLLLGLSLTPMAVAAVPPTTIVIIGCRVDDHTGEQGRQDPTMAAKGWRDLEWHLTNGTELECKREVVALQDAVVAMSPNAAAVMPLNPDFSNWAQCASVAMSYSPAWEKMNKGWAVMAVGCPVPITVDGIIKSYKLPDCPRKVGTLEISCKFDGSLI
jgi:hypothetical protein